MCEYLIYFYYCAVSKKSTSSSISFYTTTPSIKSKSSSGSNSTSASKKSDITDPGYHPEPKEEETFDERTFDEFMALNKLCYMIRGSSVCKHGFKINFKNRCLSVFSCSHLGQYKNDAAVLLVGRQSSSLRFATFRKQADHSEVKVTTITSTLFHGTHKPMD